MSNKVAIAAFASRKCADELNDPLPKINWQRQDRAQLDHDRVHLPKAIVKIEIEQRLNNAEMRGRAHREEFGEPFNDAEQDRQEKIVHRNFFYFLLSTFYLLERLHPAFCGPDPHTLFDLRDENFSVADLSGLGRVQNCLNRALYAIVGDHDLKFHFRKKIDRVLAAAINFTVTFLAAKTFYLAQRHPFHAHSDERLFHRFGFKRFDNRLDFFHRGQSKTGKLKRKRGQDRRSPRRAPLHFDRREFGLDHFAYELRKSSGRLPPKHLVDLIRTAD